MVVSPVTVDVSVPLVMTEVKPLVVMALRLELLSWPTPVMVVEPVVV